MTWKYPLKVQAEFDNEPIYVVDQDDVEVARFQRSDKPEDDLAVARWWAWERNAVNAIGLP